MSQTPPPAELILIDDASGDGTRAKLQELKHRYGHAIAIEVIELEENLGAGPARNVGWECASQPYLAFLDADDAWHPQKLAIQYGWMNRNPTVMLCGHDVLNAGTNASATSQFPPIWTVSIVRPSRLLLSNPFSMSTVMVHRILPFRFEPVYSADQLLWFRIILAGHRAYKLHLPLGYLYKPPYGHSGLSADLWRMEQAELENYRRIRKDKLINAAVYAALLPYSLAKYVRRVLLVNWNGYNRVYGS